jgi:small conductance mechanosensitive channel
MKKRFDELGIEIPFPHVTLYFGADKEGRAPPARVRLDSAGEAETGPKSESKPTPESPKA